MGLPEYDNRPQPGEPLYSSPDEGWENIKFMAYLIAFPVLIILAIGGFFFGLFGILLSFLRAIVH